MAQPPPRELEIRHLALRRGRRRVLGAGELRLPANAVIALVGANGSGKSTLLAAAANVAPPSIGHARLALDGALVTSVAYLPQHPELPPSARVADVARACAIPLDRIEPDLAASGCAELLARDGEALSEGERRFVCATLALARRLPVTLLDEPLAGLDPRRRASLLHQIARARQEESNATIILASHEMTELHDVCDWVVALRDGAVAYSGRRDSLLAPPVASARRFAELVGALIG